MSETQGRREKAHWRAAPELPEEVFSVCRKPDRAIDPVAIVATVDPDGRPRTAPFGSVRAITPRLLRMISDRRHDTYTNLCRDGWVSVALLAPPDIAVSIRGRARVIREQMHSSDWSALLEIEVEEVKNDMVRSGSIGSAVTFFPRDELQQWFDARLHELEEA